MSDYAHTGSPMEIAAWPASHIYREPRQEGVELLPRVLKAFATQLRPKQFDVKSDSSSILQTVWLKNIAPDDCCGFRFKFRCP